MSQFDEAIRRHDAQRRQADATSSQAASRELQVAERVAGIVRQSLADMARHLAANGEPTYTHVWKSSSKRFAAKSSSPDGFVLSCGIDTRINSVARLELLTRDGRLWHYLSPSGGKASGYVDVTGEAIAQRRVHIGEGRVQLNDEGEPEFDYRGDRTKPYFDVLAELSQAVLSPRPFDGLLRLSGR